MQPAKYFVNHARARVIVKRSTEHVCCLFRCLKCVCRICLNWCGAVYLRDCTFDVHSDVNWLEFPIWLFAWRRCMRAPCIVSIRLLSPRNGWKTTLSAFQEQTNINKAENWFLTESSKLIIPCALISLLFVFLTFYLYRLAQLHRASSRMSFGEAGESTPA